MKHGDLLKDPYYAQIIFEIEGHIHDYDAKNRTRENVELRDSDIKSALRKTMSMVRGSGPSKAPKNERESLKGILAAELMGIHEFLSKSEGTTRAEFVDALLAVEGTLKTRREMAGHSRGYLEFLEGFIPEARGEQ